MATGGFSAHELFEIAREMEEEGLAFYKAMARQANDSEAKAMFLKLASDEVEHVRVIDELDKKAEEYFPSEENSLVAQYVRGLVDTEVFPPLSKVPEIAASTSGLLKAIDYGIGAEKRAMDFYSKAKIEANDEEAAAALGRLYAEEEKHLVLLDTLRRNYA